MRSTYSGRLESGRINGYLYISLPPLPPFLCFRDQSKSESFLLLESPPPCFRPSDQDSLGWRQNLSLLVSDKSETTGKGSDISWSEISVPRRTFFENLEKFGGERFIFEQSVKMGKVRISIWSQKRGRTMWKGLLRIYLAFGSCLIDKEDNRLSNPLRFVHQSVKTFRWSLLRFRRNCST